MPFSSRPISPPRVQPLPPLFDPQPPRPPVVLLAHARWVAIPQADARTLAASADGPKARRYLDQGKADKRLVGYQVPEGLTLEVAFDAPVVKAPAALAFGDDGTPYVPEVAGAKGVVKALVVSKAGGPAGFADALRRAAEMSSRLHIHYLDEPLTVAVQRIPAMYDEVWTAGKGSYKLQRPGVLALGGEIVLFAPHIHQFHSDPELDAAIRVIGYHGLEYVVEYLRRNPDFNRNVAAHVINVRGIGSKVNGVERFGFGVTLASQIGERECARVGLGYRDPAGVREEDYRGAGRLWIKEGGQWLYARR